MISLIITLVVVGVLLYLGNLLLPLDPTVKKVITALVFLCLFVYVLEGFGIFTGLPTWGAHHSGRFS